MKVFSMFFTDLVVMFFSFLMVHLRWAFRVEQRVDSILKKKW